MTTTCTSTSCEARLNPGDTRCPRCSANASLLSVVLPALQRYLDNHPDPAVDRMRDLLQVLAEMGLSGYPGNAHRASRSKVMDVPGPDACDTSVRPEDGDGTRTRP